MKKCAYLILALFLLSVTGYGSQASNDISAGDPLASDTIPEPKLAAGMKITEIKEKFFATQVDDIYINSGDYVGTLIKLEGVYTSEIYPGNNQMYHFVSRYTEGCCPGEMFMSGFEVVYDGEYPEQNAWVEAIGVLERYEEDGIGYIHLILTSLKILEESGELFVQ